MRKIFSGWHEADTHISAIAPYYTNGDLWRFSIFSNEPHLFITRAEPGDTYVERFNSAYTTKYICRVSRGYVEFIYTMGPLGDDEFIIVKLLEFVDSEDGYLSVWGELSWEE